MKTGNSYIRIYLQAMEVKIRIGLKPFERKPQRVKVSAELFTNPQYLNNVTPKSIIDYAAIWEQVRTWPGRPHQDLIEPYLKELLDLAFEFKSVTAARISLSKPDIFSEAKEAGVEVFMTRADYKKLISRRSR